jgi:hypothetical protein
MRRGIQRHPPRRAGEDDLAFEILGQSDHGQVFHVPTEFADLATDTPVVDCGLPRERFRVTLLLKGGSGESTFDLQVADDLAFTQNVRTVGEWKLNPTTDPGRLLYLRTLRGPQQFLRIVTNGTALYDVRIEWA